MPGPSQILVDDTHGTLFRGSFEKWFSKYAKSQDSFVSPALFCETKLKELRTYPRAMMDIESTSFRLAMVAHMFYMLARHPQLNALSPFFRRKKCTFVHIAIEVFSPLSFGNYSLSYSPIMTKTIPTLYKTLSNCQMTS